MIFCIFVQKTFMHVDLHTKLKAMLWDMPEVSKINVADEILANPVAMFMNDDQIFIKALNSLNWYELIRLVGKQNLLLLLTDSTIQKLFPVQRRTYYTNARRLLSKYAVSAPR
jgi:hypothetical protein